MKLLTYIRIHAYRTARVKYSCRTAFLTPAIFPSLRKKEHLENEYSSYKIHGTLKKKTNATMKEFRFLAARGHCVSNNF
jgi:hypothetical protein